MSLFNGRHSNIWVRESKNWSISSLSAWGRGRVAHTHSLPPNSHQGETKTWWVLREGHQQPADRPPLPGFYRAPSSHCLCPSPQTCLPFRGGRERVTGPNWGSGPGLCWQGAQPVCGSWVTRTVRKSHCKHEWALMLKMEKWQKGVRSICSLTCVPWRALRAVNRQNIQAPQ